MAKLIIRPFGVGVSDIDMEEAKEKIVEAFSWIQESSVSVTEKVLRHSANLLADVHDKVEAVRKQRQIEKVCLRLKHIKEAEFKADLYRAELTKLQSNS